MSFIGLPPTAQALHVIIIIIYITCTISYNLLLYWLGLLIVARPTRDEYYAYTHKYNNNNIMHSHALMRRSYIFSVRSWLPVTTLLGSPMNLAAITLAQCPVSVCWNNDNIHVLLYYNVTRTEIITIINKI